MPEEWVIIKGEDGELDCKVKRANEQVCANIYLNLYSIIYNSLPIYTYIYIC